MVLCKMTDELLVSGSGDSTARVWSLQSLDCQHVLEGHTDTVNEVVIKVGQSISIIAQAIIPACFKTFKGLIFNGFFSLKPKNFTALTFS